MNDQHIDNPTIVPDPILNGNNWRGPDGKLLPGHPPLPGVGRPKGSISITEAIKRRLMEEYPDPEAPASEKKLYLEKIIDTIMDNALKGKDARTLKDIWAYMDGMPRGSMEIGVDRDNLAELTVYMKALANPQK